MFHDLGVIPITIELPFRLNHVNCFLAEGENGWAIMDAALNNETARSTWEKALQGKEVDTIYISHYHPDHFGYAGGLQKKTGATVWMTKTDEENGLNSWEPGHLDPLIENYRLCGTPEELSGDMFENTEDFVQLVTPYPNVQKHFEEGQIVPFGKYEYEAFETPGHSEGMIVLFNKEKSVLFSTDHILPKITPNISYWFHGNPDPLQQFIDSLHKIKKLDAEYVIPSHGKPFLDANKRIDELIAHHDSRLNVVLDLLKEPLTAFEVCQNMFHKKLTIHESRFALGEALAHLQYLYFKGEITKQIVDGVYLFERKK